MHVSRSLEDIPHTRWVSLALALALLQACGRSIDDRQVSDLRSANGTSDVAPDTFRVSSGTVRGHVAAHAINWDAPTVAGHLAGIGLKAEAVGIATRPTAMQTP